MTDAEIRKSGRAALVAKHPMIRVSRAVEKGETQGFIKIAVDAETKQILGAAILGTGGDEVNNVLLGGLYVKMPSNTLQGGKDIYSNVSAYLSTILFKI